jgi:hypothetical protein
MSRVFNFAGLSWLQENNYSIVAFDCFGCGSSPKPKDPSAYSHAEMFAGALTLPDHRSFADDAWQPLHFPASLPPDHEPAPSHNPILLTPVFTAAAPCPALSGIYRPGGSVPTGARRAQHHHLPLLRHLHGAPARRARPRRRRRRRWRQRHRRAGAARPGLRSGPLPCQEHPGYAPSPPRRPPPSPITPPRKLPVTNSHRRRRRRRYCG